MTSIGMLINWVPVNKDSEEYGYGYGTNLYGYKYYKQDAGYYQSATYQGKPYVPFGQPYGQNVESE
jgi:hypothetical protein